MTSGGFWDTRSCIVVANDTLVVLHDMTVTARMSAAL